MSHWEETFLLFAVPHFSLRPRVSNSSVNFSMKSSEHSGGRALLGDRSKDPASLLVVGPTGSLRVDKISGTTENCLFRILPFLL